MNKLYQDTMTDQMRHDLSLFCYQQGYLNDYVDEPVFGHYIPDMIFTNEPNYHKPVDGFYYAAAGQEVPPEPVKKPWYKDAEVVAMLITIFSVWAALALCNYLTGL
jgi:hypothetical protein